MLLNEYPSYNLNIHIIQVLSPVNNNTTGQYNNIYLRIRARLAHGMGPAGLWWEGLRDVADTGTSMGENQGVVAPDWCL